MIKIRNILEVQEEIKSCEESRTISDKNKIIRFSILKTYIDILKNRAEYKELKKNYIEKCIQLNYRMEEGVLLGKDLEENLGILQDYIEHSSFMAMLDTKIVRNASFKELKNATYPLRKEMEKGYDTFALSIDIHYLIHAMIDNIMKRVSLVKVSLGSTMDKELLEKCRCTESESNGRNVVSIKAKSIPEYLASRDIVYMKLDEMLESQVINQTVYDCATLLVNEVFNYYIDGLDEIIISPSLKKEKSFNKKKGDVE